MSGIDEAGRYTQGLLGKVTVGPHSEAWPSLARYAEPDAVRLPNDLYFSQLYVKTRPFTEGFPTFAGDKVRDALGTELIEWFRIDFSGYLRLTAGDEPGAYEFALLADDGVELRIGESELIRYDGVTPSRLLCGSSPKNLAAGAAYPLSLAYFQGPRYHITLTLMWRKVTAETLSEPLCGVSGNAAWYRYAEAGSPPTANVTALEARGWKVVPPANFRLPLNQIVNPCQSERVRAVFETAPL